MKCIKHFLLALESAVLGFWLIQAFVRLVEAVLFRLAWAWGRIRFGALVRKKGIGCVCGWNTELKYPGNITLGDHVVIGTNVSIGAHASVVVGDRVRISREVIIETAGLDFSTQEPPYKHISKPIAIGTGTWVGARAIILGGVTIGEFAVIAAGAIVTKDVHPRTIVAGSPARPAFKKEGT